MLPVIADSVMDKRLDLVAKKSRQHLHLVMSFRAIADLEDYKFGCVVEDVVQRHGTCSAQ